MPKGVRTVLETAVTLAVALAIAWLAQAFVIKPYRVPTPSMVPTLLPGDRVLADRLTLDSAVRTASRSSSFTHPIAPSRTPTAWASHSPT